MLENLTKLTKEALIKQIETLMGEGQVIILFQRNRDEKPNFKEFGFKFFITMSEEEFDGVYINEKVALMFHDSYYYIGLDETLELIQSDDLTEFENLLTFGRR